jgi:hypothetical protein
MVILKSPPMDRTADCLPSLIIEQSASHIYPTLVQ